MPWAGWCAQCGQYVWLNETGGCVNGHGPETMSNVYQTDPAQQASPRQAVTPVAQPVARQEQQAAAEPVPAEVTQPAPVAQPAPAVQPAAAQPAAQPAPAATAPFGSKEAVLQAIEYAVFAEEALAARRSQETDIELVAAMGGQGQWDDRKVKYKAMMRADEASRTVFFWERTVETGSATGGGFEMTSQSGGKSWGKTMSGSFSPGKGAQVDYVWDYGKTRTLVQGAVESQQWKFKTVIMKGKALNK